MYRLDAPAPRRMSRARRHRTGRRRARWLLALAFCLALGTGLAGALAAAGGWQGVFGLLWIQDDFLDTAQVDMTQTTAVVDTAAGVVRLPQVPRQGANHLPPLAALRPGETKVVLAVPSTGQQEPTDLVGFAGDGNQMRPFPPWNVQGIGPIRAVAWTGDGSHLAVALDAGVRVYGTAQDGSLRQVAAIPVAAVSLAGAPGRDLWVLDEGGAVRYFAWDGRQYREIIPRRLSGFAAIRGISSDPDRRILLVLDGERVRYYTASLLGYREIPANGVQVQGAISVAAIRGGGYRILVAGGIGQNPRTVYVGIGPGGTRLVPALDDILPEDAWGIVPSPWGDWDYAALTAWGLRYRAFDGRNMRPDPSRSIPGNWWQGVVRQQLAYVSDAVLVSRLWQAPIPVGRVRLVADAQSPPGTQLAFDVSTDGGTSWQPVSTGANVDVNPGYDFRYRIRLHTDDDLQTPVVDRVEIRQVVYTNAPAATLGMRVRVRLVK